MSRYHSYLNSAKRILVDYTGSEPFSIYQKSFFSKHKKYGSTDRRWISHLCYCYFRLGKAALNVNVEDRVLMALFLCSQTENEMIASLKPEWNNSIGNSVDEKLKQLNFPATEIFPWKDLSEEINNEKFIRSFFVQPDLFIRIRPGNEKRVKEKLDQQDLNYSDCSDSCLALPNNTKIENTIELDREAVIQDYSSQRIAEFFPFIKKTDGPLHAWDCCAASGGKSILAYDFIPKIELTVSDIRESILKNLKHRFSRAGIKKYFSFITDLQQGITEIPRSPFDLIICDAPCTGSGTWARTPEQLFFFNEKQMDEYASRQRSIGKNASMHIRKGGYFLYITCSVFRKENEDIVKYLQAETDLQLISMRTLTGYEKKADTLFAALFQKPL